MLGSDSQNSSAPNADKRDEVSRKITQLVDDLPLFPTDINQLLAAAVKPSEDGIEILRLIESDSKLRDNLLSLAFLFWSDQKFRDSRRCSSAHRCSAFGAVNRNILCQRDNPAGICSTKISERLC